MTSRLDEIKKRADAASPGPWTHCGECKCDSVSHAQGPVCTVTKGEWGDEFTSLRLEKDDGTLVPRVVPFVDKYVYGEVSEKQFLANRDFIAHAREDVPWLLAHLEAAQKVVEAARVIFPPDHVGRKTWSKEGRAVADALAEYDAAQLEENRR